MGNKKNKNIEGQYKVNDEIEEKEVRLVGDDIENEIMLVSEAKTMANEKGLDLVEMDNKPNPPVCKMMDFGQFIYKQKKNKKANAGKKVKTKEIRFSPNIGEHDFNFKLNHAKKFLEKGNNVRAYIFFKGRSVDHTEDGEYLLLTFAQELEQYGKVEQMPKLEGKKMTIFLTPIKSK